MSSNIFESPLHHEVTQWRHHLHANPELMFDVHETARFVANKLQSFGCDEVVTGIGRTGVVGVVKGRKTTSGRVVGLRADMDALPIHEATGLPYASGTSGVMHACGHDGHTAMLLGASKYLTAAREFDGTAIVIFQPAEEGGGGGREMVEDGLMDRFGVQEIYGLHNMPGIPAGQFAIRSGPLLASVDDFTIDVEGKGGHAAMPHHTIDATVTGCAIVTVLQSVVSRNIDPLKGAAVTVGSIRTPTESHNVVAQSVRIMGTVRALDADMRDVAQARVTEVVHSTAAAYGASVKIEYRRNYPITINAQDQTAFAASVARHVTGGCAEASQTLGGEDFAFMLESRPGAMILLGNGDTPMLHHPRYDFNDDIIPRGCSYWARMIDMRMPLS